MLGSVTALAQQATPVKGKIGLGAVINLSLEADDYDPSLTQMEAIHAPKGEYQEKKRYVDSLRRAEGVKPGGVLGKTAGQAPDLVFEFNANMSGGTPNDNDMCIGNNGFIISVVNSSLYVYDSTGKIKKSQSLLTFGKNLGTLDRAFDPRVLYDPIRDRFIAVFLNGSTSSTSNPIIGFSQTNDPTQAWNLYMLPGNPLGDTSWSDYPIISISDKDLFLTLNLLYDDKGWKDGFRQSIIWQMDLEDGYGGDSLTHILWKDINFNQTRMWSICPSQGGMKPSGPETYFLTVRPADLTNDSLFLHTITNSVTSGQAQLSTKLFKLSQPYGLPPSAKQPDGQFLETNDARVLTAVHQNGLVHFAGNTKNFSTNAAGVYYGVLDPTATTASVHILSFDTLDVAYPDIAYAGGGANGDHSTILTVSHVSEQAPPGTSVVYMNYSGQFSPLTRTRSGISSINELVDTFERWGDYSGIQRKYNEENVFWLAGTYGAVNNRTTIAKVANNDPTLFLASPEEAEVHIYPNPSSEYLEVSFFIEQRENLRFRVVDLTGKEITVLMEDRAKAGTSRFRFSTTPLSPGTYILLIENEGALIKSERFVVMR